MKQNLKNYFLKPCVKTSEENFKDNIDLSFKQLMTDIDKAKEEMLVAKKEEIVTILSDEIFKTLFLSRRNVFLSP